MAPWAFVPSWLNLFKNQLLIQFFHRWWAMVAAIAVFTLLYASLRAVVSWRGRLAMRALGSLVVLQILLGIMTLVARVPPLLALTHLLTGLALLAILVWIAFELKYHSHHG